MCLLLFVFVVVCLLLCAIDVGVVCDGAVVAGCCWLRWLLLMFMFMCVVVACAGGVACVCACVC